MEEAVLGGGPGTEDLCAAAISRLIDLICPDSVQVCTAQATSITSAVSACGGGKCSESAKCPICESRQLTEKVRQTIQGTWYSQNELVMVTSQALAWGIAVVTVVASPGLPALLAPATRSAHCSLPHASAPLFQ